jgi:post-segregation antitoxin (ccd killing protein)
MPRMQVYLPDDLFQAVKVRGLPASDLLRRAVLAELRRQALLEETARYVDELVAEVGIADDAAMAEAEAVADQVRRPGDTSRAS